MKITIAGGDNRFKNLKNFLKNKGFFVETSGLFENDNGNYKNSDVIILPVPTTKDKRTVFTPLTDKKIYLDEICNNAKDNALILTCNYSVPQKNFINYGALDSYALLNAVPTAEGAISLAIQNTDFTLWNSKILIIGYGRIGKILADRLKGFNAKITVSARKESDFALLEALGFDYINTELLKNNSLDYDIIFNTVDAEVLFPDNFKIKKPYLIIDLSSKGGINKDSEFKENIKYIKYSGVPNKTASKTASEILNNTILKIINSYKQGEENDWFKYRVCVLRIFLYR